METRGRYKFELFEGGRDEFETTKEFSDKTEAIRKAVREKYSIILLNERNWFRRLLITLKLKMEIRKRVQALSSCKNLHLAQLTDI